MTDLIERLRGPVREAASRLIAGAFRRDGERLDKKRPRFSIPARPDEDDDLVLTAALEEAAAALEAEASEGERRGLERAAEVANVIAGNYDVSVMAEDLEDWEVFQRREGGHASRKVAEAIRALIPEAPAREGWQPISSAPKGRVPFLALNHDGEVHVAAYDEHDRLMRRSHYALRPQSFAIEGGRKVLTSETEEWRNDWSLWTRLYEFKPTHWRPLPPPPSQDREPDSQRGAK